MRNLAILAAAGLVSAAVSAPAHALTATVSVDIIGNGSGFAAAGVAAQTAFLSGLGAGVVGSESFEGFTNGPLDPVFSTAVGTFTSAGPGTCFTACAGSVDGTITTGSAGPIDDLAIFPAPGGVSSGSRFATEGSKWLDSNDTAGIEWEIPGLAAGLGSFDVITFLTTDIDDVGSVTFNLSGSTAGFTFDLPAELGTGKRPNGELLLWKVVFSDFITSEDVLLSIDGGDGFGIDSVKIAVTPLPAAAWLLMGGVAALFGLRRTARRTA